MLELVIGHMAKCEKCGRETECARVSFWDKSFTGLICWADLQEMVAEKSQDPEARKKFAAMRPEHPESVTQQPPGESWWQGEQRGVSRGTTISSSEGITKSVGYSHTETKSVGRSDDEN